MKRITTLITYILMCATMSWAQSGMTDDQVMDYVIEQNAKGMSRQQIVTQLMQRGVSIEQIQRLQKKYQKQQKGNALGSGASTTGVDDRKNRLREANGEKRSEEKTEDKNNQPQYQTYENKDKDFVEMDKALASMIPENDANLFMKEEKRKIFGHDIFNNKNLTFESSMNLATPQNYILGPGDQVNVDIWGDSQESFIKTISPDGTITIENIGVIQLGGLNVSQAKNHVRVRR